MPFGSVLTIDTGNGAGTASVSDSLKNPLFRAVTGKNSGHFASTHPEVESMGRCLVSDYLGKHRRPAVAGYLGERHGGHRPPLDSGVRRLPSGGDDVIGLRGTGGVGFHDSGLDGIRQIVQASDFMDARA